MTRPAPAPDGAAIGVWRPQHPEPVLLPMGDQTSVALHDLGGIGPHLLLAHATGLHGWAYEPMARFLVDRFHCWAVDFRGHGDSRLRDTTEISWSGFGSDLLAVLDQIGDEPIFGFGHSLGGSALLLAAARRPEAFRGLLLYEPAVPPAPHAVTDHFRTHLEFMIASASRRRAEFASRAEALLNFATKAPMSHFNARALAAYVEHGLADTTSGVQLKCRPETEAAIYASALDQGTRGLVSEMRCPVHVAHGAATDALQRDSAIELQVAAGTNAVVMAGLNHFGPLQNPGQVADTVVAVFGA